MPYRQLAERFLDPPEPKPLPTKKRIPKQKRRAFSVVLAVLCTSMAGFSALTAAACVTFWVTFGRWVVWLLR